MQGGTLAVDATFPPCSSYVQINIYDTNVKRLRERGIDIRKIVEHFGCRSVVMDVPFVKENTSTSASTTESFGKDDLADSDAGGSQCAVINPHGKENADLTALAEFCSPTFVDNPQIKSRDDGQVMVMEFRAKSILKPTFAWHKGDEIVAQSDRVNIVLRQEANDIYYAALEIKKPTKEKDAGQFICTARNGSGKLTATFTVKFEVPQGAPAFTRKPLILPITSDTGDPAILFDIGFQADQDPKVMWFNPKGKEIVNTSRIYFYTCPDGPKIFTTQLLVKNHKVRDSGTYACTITNDAGEANVELTLDVIGVAKDEGDDGDEA
ncbi:unnamed protein product [Cylicocyclus nassatus]|uniref:Ig-like domain-containing protein n=1 Tax=Cylicocyclus nassatus TaxID=53992 RepID=A0AA36HH12_CYLNA|nr:unnamed protein product [Cylicocyclus nassatus]